MEERNSRDYSAEREIRKNRREKKNRRKEDLGHAGEKRRRISTE